MLGKHTVLAMGHDPETLRQLTGILSGAGLNPVAQENAEAEIEAGPVGAVILDCEPGADMWKAILREICRPAGIPLIVTSRHADERLWSEVIDCGGFDLLAQPLDCAEVRRVVMSALRNGPTEFRAAPLKLYRQ